MILLLLYPKHVIKLSWYNLGCYSSTEIILCIFTDFHRVDRVIPRTRPSPSSFSRSPYHLVLGNGIDSISPESVMNRPSRTRLD